MESGVARGRSLERSGRTIVWIGLVSAAIAGCGGAGAPIEPPDVPSLATLEALRSIDPALCSRAAMADLSTLVERFPDAPEVRTAQVAYYERCGEWQALANLLGAIPAEARTEANTAALARIRIRYLHQFAEGEALVRPLLEAHPTNIDYVSLLAAALYYQQRFAEVTPLVDRHWFEIVAARNVDIMTMRGEAFMEEGKSDRAIRVLRDVLAIDPRHAFAQGVLGRALAISGDDAGSAAVLATLDAQRAAEEARSADTTWINDRLLELREAMAARRFEESERLARSMIPRLPEDRKHEMYRTLKEIYIALGRFPDAEKAVGIADALEQGTPEAALDTEFGR